MSFFMALPTLDCLVHPRNSIRVPRLFRISFSLLWWSARWFIHMRSNRSRFLTIAEIPCLQGSPVKSQILQLHAFLTRSTTCLSRPLSTSYMKLPAGVALKGSLDAVGAG
nr:uncharacterized protein LOC112010923 isoform X2 [Quercus suber]